MKVKFWATIHHNEVTVADVDIRGDMTRRGKGEILEFSVNFRNGDLLTRGFFFPHELDELTFLEALDRIESGIKFAANNAYNHLTVRCFNYEQKKEVDVFDRIQRFFLGE